MISNPELSIDYVRNEVQKRDEDYEYDYDKFLNKKMTCKIIKENSNNINYKKINHNVEHIENSNNDSIKYEKINCKYKNKDDNNIKKEKDNIINYKPTNEGSNNNTIKYKKINNNNNIYEETSDILKEYNNKTCIKTNDCIKYIVQLGNSRLTEILYKKRAC